MTVELNKHMIWGAVAIVVVALAVVIGVAWYGSNTYERLLARAETQEEAYRKDVKDMQTQLKASEDARVEATKQQTVIEKHYIDTNKAADNKITEIVNPDRESPQVAQDVKTYFGILPNITPLGKFEFEKKDVQGFLALKIDHDRLFSNVTDLQKQYALEQTKTASLSLDLTNVKGKLTEADTVIAAWKDVGKKSRWHTVLDYGVKVGFAGAGFAAGRYLK